MSPLPITGMSVSGELTDKLGLTGKLPLKIDETVVPVVQVGNVTPEAQWGPQAIGRINVPINAGFRSEIEMSLPWTPEGSLGNGLYLENLLLANSAAGWWEIGWSLGMAAPTHFGDTSWVDGRRQGGPLAVINGKNDAAATAITVLLNLYVHVGTYELRLPNWILRPISPGSDALGLLIRPGADATVARLTAVWRELVPR